MRMMRLAGLAPVVFLAACQWLGSSYVDVRNDGEVPMSAVEIEVGGKRHFVSLIKPKGVARINFDPVSDSDIRIYYVTQRRKQACVGDFYVTTGMRIRLSATINTDGGCSVQEVE